MVYLAQTGDGSWYKSPLKYVTKIKVFSGFCLIGATVYTPIMACFGMTEYTVGPLLHGTYCTPKLEYFFINFSFRRLFALRRRQYTPIS